VGLPRAFQEYPSSDSAPGEMPITEDSLATLMETLTQIFHPDKAPTLTAGGNIPCADARPSPPASYCPATNTINVDLPGLQKMGTYTDKESRQLLQGDDTAFSVVTSRYMLAIQHGQGISLTGERAALRTACLTGVAQRDMATPVPVPSGHTLVLNAGDLDEAISGLLTNHLVASDTNGDSVPAGFTRIVAFRSGLVTSRSATGTSHEPPSRTRVRPPTRAGHTLVPAPPDLRRPDQHCQTATNSTPRKPIARTSPGIPSTPRQRPSSANAGHRLVPTTSRPPTTPRVRT
jgi:hypothetical protein